MSERQKKAAERYWFEVFRRKWSGASDLLSAHSFEAPDFRGWLASGRQYGLEIVSLTERTLAWDEDYVLKVFVPELKAAATAASINGTFFAAFTEYDAARLRSDAHRAQVVAWFMNLARDPNRPPPVMRRPEVLRRGCDALEAASFEPRDEGVTVMTGRNARGRASGFVQECIAAKNAKAAQYRRRIPSGADLWLLLVSGASFASGVAVPPPEPPFETTFDRVFFLDCTDRWRFNSVLEGPAKDRVVELPIRRLQPEGDA